MRIRALMEAHFDFVWRSLRRLGLSADDADLGAQQVFVIASRKLRVIVPQSERRFLFAAALRFAARSRGLERRREQPHASLGEETDEPRATEEARLRRDLNEILSAMKLEQRAVFVLYELEEMAVTEIATLLDLPVETVSSRLRVAREEFDLVLRRARAQLPGVKG